MREAIGFLLALFAAFLLWYALRERAPVVERALSVPLTVVGLSPEQVAEGVPKEVILRLRGPAPLVEGPSPPVSAYLDLSGAEGAFAREVRVAVPQGVEVLEVRPARVEGRVEAVLERQLPVEVLAQGAWVVVEPVLVQARGPKSQVEAAVAAVGLDQGAETVSLTAFGLEGPLPGVTLTPGEVRVLERREALFLKEVPVVFKPPSGLRVLDFAPQRVRVVGPREALEGLEEVEALPLGGFRPGEVEGPWTLRLPPGVYPVGDVVGRVRLALE